MSETLNFGQALEHAKEGKKICREGWNGKGMYIYHVPENSYPAVTEIAKNEFGEQVPYGAYLAMKTVQNNVLPWVTSQADVLAQDWMVLA